MTIDGWASRAERRLPWARRATWLVLVLAVVSCGVRGGGSPADPYLVDEAPPATTAEGAATRTLLAGFEDVALRITTPDGEQLDWCALLAATEQARARGLMEVRDLGGYDGMVFRFDSPTSGRFYMFGTVLPLSIAWFDEDGAYIGQADMEPCPADEPGECPTYPAERPFLHALEVPKGGLAALGVVPGSTLSFPAGPSGGCP